MEGTMESKEVEEALTRLTPPGVISVTSFMGIPLADWVYILTIMYLMLQIVWICKKFYNSYKVKKK